jgi:hypothetical protein
MLGHAGLSLDPLKIRHELREAARRNIKLYKRIRPIVITGKLYRLLGPPPADDYAAARWCAFQYVARDGSEALLFVFRPESPIEEMTVPLRGLRPDAPYRIEGTSGSIQECSGNVLVKKGLRLALPDPNSSVIYRLRCLADPPGVPRLHRPIPQVHKPIPPAVPAAEPGPISQLEIRVVDANGTDSAEIVELTWKAPPSGRSHHYEVFRGRQESFPLDREHRIGTCWCERYIDAERRAGTTHFYAVKAVGPDARAR